MRFSAPPIIVVEGLSNEISLLIAHFFRHLGFLHVPSLYLFLFSLHVGKRALGVSSNLERFHYHVPMIGDYLLIVLEVFVMIAVQAVEHAADFAFACADHAELFSDRLIIQKHAAIMNGYVFYCIALIFFN